MKKRLIAIVSIIISLFISVGMFSGCNLITTNGERDNEQVIATVNIGNEGYEADKIIKKDVMNAYYNYGYYYQYYNGYTAAQTFELIINNLINSRIYLQTAMKEMEENNAVEDASKEKWDITRYLNDEELTDAEYETKKYMNDLIDSYANEEKKKDKKDTLAESVRTVPTDAKNAEKEELTTEEKKEYKVDKGEDGTERKKFYNKTLKLLKDNGLLGESVTDIVDSDYYRDVLKSNRESRLLTKYDESLDLAERKAVKFESLAEKYADMYNDQKNNYTGNEKTFSEALSSATAKNPVVYNPYDGSYGYVFNLLLGADDAQKALIGQLKHDADYNKNRNAILADTIVKDLRSTWIKSGYDFDGTYFTGDYTFAKDAANSHKFYGATEKIKEKTDDASAEYKVKSVTEFTVDEFFAEMDRYLGITGGENTNNVNDAVYRKAVVASGVVTEYQAKINELLFAFSTDDGSLNTYKGYVIAPKPDLDGKETYVEEFAKAGRELLAMGGNSYVVVSSDYGYHVMFYSEVLSASSNYETLTAYLNHLTGENKTEAEWKDYYENEIVAKWDDADTNDFLYVLANVYGKVSDKVTEKKNGISDKYLYDTAKVVKYEKAYADLIAG